jgi:hypothetical protein
MRGNVELSSDSEFESPIVSDYGKHYSFAKCTVDAYHTLAAGSSGGDSAKVAQVLEQPLWQRSTQTALRRPLLDAIYFFSSTVIATCQHNVIAKFG